ncbi:MAG: T9SS type A sorting domain-containing protein [Bacteroidota bacterium]
MIQQMKTTRIILAFILMHLSVMLFAQVIQTSTTLNPSQVHTFTLEKTNMTLNPVSSGQNYGSQLYYYNGGVGSNYNFLIDYYRYKFTHTGIANSDITNVSYTFNYAAHDDINHPTNPTWWSQSWFSIIIPPALCNANYWGSYTLGDCLSTESCINNGGVLLAHIGPNGAGSGTTLTQSQNISGSTLSSLLANPNDFTIAFQPDGGTTCFIDLKTQMTCQVTYNTYPITNNILSGNQSYTGSANPTLITGSVPTGGNKGIFTYQWQSSLNNSTWTNISGATTASYDPPTITQTTYYRRIVNSAPQPASTSNVITVTINAASLAAPINFSGYSVPNTLYSGDIHLSWNSSVGATSYDIYTCSGAFVANVAEPNNDYTITGLNTGTFYSYKILAKNATAISPFTGCINIKTWLSMPNDNIIYSSSCNQLGLSWDAVTGAASYDIINCSTGLLDWNTTATSFIIPGIAPGSTVTYCIRARDPYSYFMGACHNYTMPNANSGVVTASSTKICPGTPSSNLNVTGYFGSIEWQSSICNSTFQTIAGATSSSYNVTSADPTGTSFRAKVTCGSGVVYSNSVKIWQFNVCNPGRGDIPACGGGGGELRLGQTPYNSDANQSLQTNIYPNPAAAELFVDVKSIESSNINITIYDVLGKIVYEHTEENKSGTLKNTIEISAFNRGIYHVKVSDTINSYYCKIVFE